MIPYYMIVNPATFMAEGTGHYASHYPCHLFLAQVLMAADPAYCKAAATHCAAVGNCTILDNGAHEGYTVEADQYLDVVRALRPDVCVLPDLVGQSAYDSHGASLEFTELLENRAPHLFEPTEHHGPMKLMFVPQGQSKEDTLRAYRLAFSQLNPDRYIIGVGQAYLQWCQAPYEKDMETRREEMFRKIMEDPNASAFKFHILGARWQATRYYSLFPNVIGIDSIKPCACALHGLLYPERPTVKISPNHTFSASQQLLCRNVEAFAAAYGCSI